MEHADGTIVGPSGVCANVRVLVLLLFAFFGCRVEPTFAECDGPTMPPEPTDPCPPGRTAASRECPMDTCRICRTELGVPDGPAIFWTVRWTEIEVIPDEHGRWGNSRQPVRGPVVMAMWFDQGRPHGAARGFTAATDAIECAQGFARTLAPAQSPFDASMDMASGLAIEATLFKYHAACYFTHSAIEAARLERELPEGTPSADVRRGRVDLPRDRDLL